MWLAGAAVLLLAGLFAFLIAQPLMLARMQNRGERIPNPIRMVKDWLFPPDVIIVDGDELDVEQAPPVAPPVQANREGMDLPPGGNVHDR